MFVRLVLGSVLDGKFDEWIFVKIQGRISSQPLGKKRRKNSYDLQIFKQFDRGKSWCGGGFRKSLNHVEFVLGEFSLLCQFLGHGYREHNHLA